jgi:hypothetical protein
MDNTYFAKPGIKPNVQAMGSVVQDPGVDERVNALGVAVENKNTKERIGKMGNSVKELGFITKLREMMMW